MFLPKLNYSTWRDIPGHCHGWDSILSDIFLPPVITTSISTTIIFSIIIISLEENELRRIEALVQRGDL
jgi:hypothetical protein